MNRSFSKETAALVIQLWRKDNGGTAVSKGQAVKTWPAEEPKEALWNSSRQILGYDSHMYTQYYALFRNLFLCLGIFELVKQHKSNL